LDNLIKMALHKKNKKRHKKKKQLHIPKFLKFKKFFQGNLKGVINFSGVFSLQNGHAGLQVLESGYLTLVHYDMLKKFLGPVTKQSNRFVKIVNLWIYFFTDRPMTQKPLQSRMGRGKGLPTLWYSKLYFGQLIVEIDSNVSLKRAIDGLSLVMKKLPILTRIIIKADNQQSSVLLRNKALVDNIIDKNVLPPIKFLELEKLARSTNQVIYIA
jgi:large subunit ribosomal protein L16